MKKENRIIRPTVKKVEVICEGCGSDGSVFFTNREIWSNTKILQNCTECRKITTWKIK